MNLSVDVSTTARARSSVMYSSTSLHQLGQIRCDIDISVKEETQLGLLLGLLGVIRLLCYCNDRKVDDVCAVAARSES